MSDSVRPRRRQSIRLLCPWDSPCKNTGVGCHFLLQCMKVKSESEVTPSCPTLSDPMACSPPGFSVHGIFQARVLEWGAIAFSDIYIHVCIYMYAYIYMFFFKFFSIMGYYKILNINFCVIQYVLVVLACFFYYKSKPFCFMAIFMRFQSESRRESLWKRLGTWPWSYRYPDHQGALWPSPRPVPPYPAAACAGSSGGSI